MLGFYSVQGWPPRLAAGWASIFGLVFAFWLSPVSAAELDDAQKLYYSGKYAECIDACQNAIESNAWAEGWRLLKIRSELATGTYAEALNTNEATAAVYRTSIPLR